MPPAHCIYDVRFPRDQKRTPPYWVVFFFGDPYGNRTHVTAVKGRCLNRLTNGPGSGDLIRTGDIPGMNRLLYQLSYAAIFQLLPKSALLLYPPGYALSREKFRKFGKKLRSRLFFRDLCDYIRSPLASKCFRSRFSTKIKAPKASSASKNTAIRLITATVTGDISPKNRDSTSTITAKTPPKII